MTNRITSRHSMVAALAVVVVALMAGGTAFASNTGFKFNMPIANSGGGGQQGHNWVGLPYFNPYASADSFCVQVGLRPVVDSITTIGISGAPTQVQCGSAAAAALTLPPAEGIRIIVPSTPAGGPTSVIVVGSHNATQTITLPLAGVPPRTAAQDWLFFSVPYHTTAVTREDLCAQIGLTPVVAQLLTIDPVTGSPDQTSCGSPANAAKTLVLGQAVRIRQQAGPVTFTPAHF